MFAMAAARARVFADLRFLPTCTAPRTRGNGVANGTSVNSAPLLAMVFPTTVLLSMALTRNGYNVVILAISDSHVVDLSGSRSGQCAGSTVCLPYHTNRP